SDAKYTYFICIRVLRHLGAAILRDKHPFIFIHFYFNLSVIHSRLDVGHTKSCDFETVSLCGWKEDTENDFHWMQRNGWNSYEKLESGPKHDHTKGKPLEGHYLIAEATNSHPSQRSRLFSPVYNQSDSENACFRFFYYMYGQNVGRLRIIIKSVVDKMDKVVDNQKYIFFEKEGSQGNQWIVGDIPVEPTNADFQIMIEVTGSKGVISDIAIDDVALMKDSDCLNNIQSEATTETDEIFDIQSCENRCMETGSVRENTNGTFYRNGHLIEKCDCHQECIILNTCCFDFITKCVEDLTIATMDEINTTEVSITEATTPRSISTSRDVEATLPDIHTRLVKDTSSTPNTKTTNPENASLRTSNITSTKMVTTVTTQKIIVTTTFSPNRGSIVTQSTSIPLISNPKNTHISKSINFQKHKQLPKTKIDQTILYTPSSSILVITSTSTDATLRAMLIPAKKQNSLRDLTWIFALLSLSILLILTTITWKYLSANRWNNYSSHHVQYKSNYHSEDNEETLVRSGDTSNEILIENKSDSKAKKYSTEKIISLPNLTKMVSDCLTKRCDQYSEKQRLTVNDEQFDFSLQINYIIMGP
ncbi:uncharacterized protein LOC116341763, partial [Contarinia nasturtii]|uniref:uncharacterized protein LOC116341763 n=1 Tax=Contarinia nasturtii TaxID=265458 RepID=UPI0012D41368